jgi:large subunit ribosomal protein L35
MPKMKPHKSSQRRLTVSANGKIRFKRPGGGHLMSGKSGRRCQRLRKLVNVNGKLHFNYVREMGVEAKWRRAHARAIAAAAAAGSAQEQTNAKN